MFLVGKFAEKTQSNLLMNKVNILLMNQKQDIAALSFVLDSNIFISALIKDGITRKIILQSGFYFYAPYTFLDEINKHKEEIIQK